MDSVQHSRNASILQPPVYPRKARSASNIEQGGGSRRFVVSDLDRLMHEVDTALMNEVESEEVESSSKFNVGSDPHSPSSPTEQQLSGESSDSESEFESASMNDNSDDLPPVSEPLTSGSVREISETVESVPESSSSPLERKQVSVEDNPLGIRSRVDSVVRLQRARSFALPIPDELTRSESFLERARSGSVRQLLHLPSPTEESGGTSTTPIADSQQGMLIIRFITIYIPLSNTFTFFSAVFYERPACKCETMEIMLVPFRGFILRTCFRYLRFGYWFIAVVFLW